VFLGHRALDIHQTARIVKNGLEEAIGTEAKVRLQCVRHAPTLGATESMSPRTIVNHGAWSHGAFETPTTPFRSHGAEIAVRGLAPEVGEHTFELLAALGIEGEDLTELVTSGILG
jgi:crotonobetainyl-CoA:carnitine CoA-transferase CaiB-like acyl-CoA transferase